MLSDAISTIEDHPDEAAHSEGGFASNNGAPSPTNSGEPQPTESDPCVASSADAGRCEESTADEGDQGLYRLISDDLFDSAFGSPGEEEERTHFRLNIVEGSQHIIRRMPHNTKFGLALWAKACERLLGTLTPLRRNELGKSVPSPSTPAAKSAISSPPSSDASPDKGKARGGSTVPTDNVPSATASNKRKSVVTTPLSGTLFKKRRRWRDFWDMHTKVNFREELWPPDGDNGIGGSAAGGVFLSLGSTGNLSASGSEQASPKQRDGSPGGNAAAKSSPSSPGDAVKANELSSCEKESSGKHKTEGTPTAQEVSETGWKDLMKSLLVLQVLPFAESTSVTNGGIAASIFDSLPPDLRKKISADIDTEGYMWSPVEFEFSAGKSLRLNGTELQALASKITTSVFSRRGHDLGKHLVEFVSDLRLLGSSITKVEILRHNNASTATATVIKTSASAAATAFSDEGGTPAAPTAASEAAVTAPNLVLSPVLDSTPGTPAYERAKQLAAAANAASANPPAAAARLAVTPPVPRVAPLNNSSFRVPRQPSQPLPPPMVKPASTIMMRPPPPPPRPPPPSGGGPMLMGYNHTAGSPQQQQSSMMFGMLPGAACSTAGNLIGGLTAPNMLMQPPAFVSPPGLFSRQNEVLGYAANVAQPHSGLAHSSPSIPAAPPVPDRWTSGICTIKHWRDPRLRELPDWVVSTLLDMLARFEGKVVGAVDQCWYSCYGSQLDFRNWGFTGLHDLVSNIPGVNLRRDGSDYWIQLVHTTLDEAIGERWPRAPYVRPMPGGYIPNDVLSAAAQKAKDAVVNYPMVASERVPGHIAAQLLDLVTRHNGKNIAYIQQVWKKEHNDVPLDFIAFGFSKFSYLLQEVPGINIVKEGTTITAHCVMNHAAALLANNPTATRGTHPGGMGGSPGGSSTSYPNMLPARFGPAMLGGGTPPASGGTPPPVVGGRGGSWTAGASPDPSQLLMMQQWMTMMQFSVNGNPSRSSPSPSNLRNSHGKNNGIVKVF